MGTSHSKCRYITIAVILTLFASATTLRAQTHVAQPNCQGRCVYGVEGTCSPQGPFGFTHTQWRKWPEPPPAIPQRMRDSMEDRTDGSAELDLPQPDDESDANPEFSHLKNNEGSLSSDLGTNDSFEGYDSDSISIPGVELPDDDGEAVPPMPEISDAMGGDTSTPSVDLPPIDGEAPTIFGPADDAGDTTSPSLEDFDLDLDSRNMIPSEGSYVNRLRRGKTDFATVAPGNPLRFSSFSQAADDTNTPSADVIPAGFVHPNVVKPALSPAIPTPVTVHESKPAVGNPLR